MFKESAKDFANSDPTSNEPIRPGACVKQIAFKEASMHLAVSRAAFTTGTMFCICAREASSGTTPPYCSCTDWLAMTFERILPSTQIDAAVSSQDDSIPNIQTLPSFKAQIL